MDVALPDPQLPPSPEDALQSTQRNFDALTQAAQQTANEIKDAGDSITSLENTVNALPTLAAGSETLSFSSASKASQTITHGLGATPTVVVATADRGVGAGDLWNVTVGSIGATTFVAEVSNIAGTNSTTAKIYWLAIAV